MDCMFDCSLLIGGSLIKADGDFAGAGVSRGGPEQAVHARNALTGGTVQYIQRDLFGKLHIKVVHVVDSFVSDKAVVY